jgi:maleylacetate reductase
MSHALGSRCGSISDHMLLYMPRSAVIEAAEQVREAEADLIATVGGGLMADGAKAARFRTGVPTAPWT